MPGTIEEAIVHVAFQFAAKEGVLLGSPTALVDYLTKEGILPLEKIEKFTYQRLREFCDEYQRMVSVHKDGAGPSSSPVARARPNRDAPDAMSVESSDSAYESYTTSWLEKTEVNCPSAPRKRRCAAAQSLIMMPHARTATLSFDSISTPTMPKLAGSPSMASSAGRKEA